MEQLLVPYRSLADLPGKRFLVLAPHPDDEVFGCGGTLARLCERGAFVKVIVCTDGAARSNDRAATIKTRQQESQQAAAVLGLPAPSFLGYEDRGLLYGEDLVSRIAELVNQYQVDALVAPSALEVHPDHYALALAAAESVRRCPIVTVLYAYEVGAAIRPDILVDITPVLDKKALAMKCFVSELNYQAYDSHIAGLNRYRSYTLNQGETAAEAFKQFSREELCINFQCILSDELRDRREAGLAVLPPGDPKRSKVSVLIRSMDRDSLYRALDAVALQTWPNIEIVVVAARSVHRPLPSTWRGRELSFLVDGENKSRSVAANVALKAAKGEYLLFLDDDDVIYPSHISGLMSAIQYQSRFQAVYSSCEAIDFSAHRIGSFGEPFQSARLYLENFMPIHSVLFSKALVENIGFDETLAVYEDWDFWIQLSRRTDFLHVPQMSALYQAGGDSGVGLSPDPELQKKAKEALYRKWDSLTNGERTLSAIAAYLQSLQRELNSKNIEIANLQRQTADLKNLATHLESRLSRTLTGRLKKAIPRPLQSQMRVVVNDIRRFSLRGIVSATFKLCRILVNQGPQATYVALRRKVIGQLRYRDWIRAFDAMTPEDQNLIAEKVTAWVDPPKISILMPVFNTSAEFLRRAIESVIEQSYPHWELCIADDASTDPNVKTLLDSFAALDTRIKVTYRSSNGHISAASNTALSLATSNWIALLDHDDELAHNALFFFAQEISKESRVQILYSDEDKIDALGHRSDPHFKPDWNPELIRSINYVSHLGVYAKELVQAVGGFRKGYEGSQDYDLLLRCSALIQPDQIRHIPRVLYHWRAVAGSTALDSSEKSYPSHAGKKALVDFLADDPQVSHVSDGPASTTYRVHYKVSDSPSLVTIVIPTRDRVDLLSACIDSVLSRTRYRLFEILIVDNDSQLAETRAYFRDIQARDARIKVLSYPGEFNYSAINNFAVKQAQGEFILLLNNDIEVLSEDWLTEMLSHVQRPGVGAVGAKLYYTQGAIQHAGVIIGLGGVAGHSHKLFPHDAPGYFYRLKLAQDVSAVTAACLLIRKDIFLQVGGLDEVAFKVAFNDVDLCLKVRQAGHRIIWTPHAELLHHESVSRGLEDTSEKQHRFSKEVEAMHEKWQTNVVADPFYSPNLTLDREDFSVAWPPRTPSIASLVKR